MRGGAGDGDRTRDNLLGRKELYQLATRAGNGHVEPPFPYVKRLVGSRSTALSASPFAQCTYRWLVSSRACPKSACS
jgi:hypothetical protein